MHDEVEATDVAPLVYERNENDHTASDTQTAANIGNALAHFDQLVKTVKVDLVFTAARAFPMQISVTLVRFIKPTSPYTLESDDKKQLLNNLNNRGLEYQDYKVEYCHEFTLPALRVNKKPATHSVNKTIKCNFLQTNAFAVNNVADDMSDASETLLGQGIKRRVNEVADGDVSSQFYVLIKYRKRQQPTQFTYTQAIDSELAGQTGVTASVTLPALTDESFDIPETTGQYIAGQDGAPFKNDQGDESKGTFLLHGRLMYQWGFRHACDGVPSVMDKDRSQANFNKTQSLNIDPMIRGDDTRGLYTQSDSHETLAKDTSD